MPLCADLPVAGGSAVNATLPCLQGPAVCVQLPAEPVADGGGPSQLPARGGGLPNHGSARVCARAREEAGTAVQETQPDPRALNPRPRGRASASQDALHVHTQQ